MKAMKMSDGWPNIYHEGCICHFQFVPTLQNSVPVTNV